MGKTLYLECYSGISGDMTAAALLDLGADREALMKVLNSLPVQGFRVKISRVMKSGIDACDFDVILDEAHQNHDHDMEYLHGHEKEHDHAAEHIHGTDHIHGENHSHAETHIHESVHHHEHRGIQEIRHIIEHSMMTERAKKHCTSYFYDSGSG